MITASIILSLSGINEIQKDIIIEILASFTGSATITTCFFLLGSWPATCSFLILGEKASFILISSLFILLISPEDQLIKTFSIALLYVSSIYVVAWRSCDTYRNYNYFRGANLPVSISFHALLGGISFQGSDLRKSVFVEAKLKGTNFIGSRKTPTNLTHIRWHKAIDLDYAVFFRYFQMRSHRFINLLTTLDGREQDFSGFDLEDVNLAGARLQGANFCNAYLNNAILKGAELLKANLINTQCIGTDFTGAHFTGACLEAWNIDDTTELKDAECDYVFLKERPDRYGNRERRPHNPDKVFQTGDFEKFFKEMLDTVQILIRNGVDPQAFQAAFDKVMAGEPRY